MTKIKICGLFRPEDMESVNEARPDYIGFVFARSRRRVSAETAAELRKMLDPGIKVAGVFVDAPVEVPVSLVRNRIIDLIQLHGQEDETYIRNLKEKLSEITTLSARQEAASSTGLSKAVVSTSLSKAVVSTGLSKAVASTGMSEGFDSVPIIKAVRVERQEDISVMQGSQADYLLLDHGPGGTGKTFDWSLAARENAAARENEKPFFLAGGLHAGNVEDAIKILSPYAVDISTGVETDGLKDRTKIIDIVARVRQSINRV